MKHPYCQSPQCGCLDGCATEEAAKEAAAVEREACAKVADGIAIHLESHGYDTNAAEDIAERIRART